MGLLMTAAGMVWMLTPPRSILAATENRIMEHAVFVSAGMRTAAKAAVMAGRIRRVTAALAAAKTVIIVKLLHRQ